MTNEFTEGGHQGTCGFCRLLFEAHDLFEHDDGVYYCVVCSPEVKEDVKATTVRWIKNLRKPDDWYPRSMDFDTEFKPGLLAIASFLGEDGWAVCGRSQISFAAWGVDNENKADQVVSNAVRFGWVVVRAGTSRQTYQGRPVDGRRRFRFCPERPVCDTKLKTLDESPTAKQLNYSRALIRQHHGEYTAKRQVISPYMLRGISKAECSELIEDILTIRDARKS